MSCHEHILGGMLREEVSVCELGSQDPLSYHIWNVNQGSLVCGLGSRDPPYHIWKFRMTILHKICMAVFLNHISELYIRVVTP